jgi:hypothetical protein
MFAPFGGRFRDRGAGVLALCSQVRPMLLGGGLYGAGRARAAAGAATCAVPGRAVAGGVRWDVRCACAGGVGARPRRGPTLQGFGRAQRQLVSGAEEAG